MTARVIDGVPTLTLFCCGPSKCEHDYSGWVEFKDGNGGGGGTAVCAKCGARAIDEALWGDE